MMSRTTPEIYNYLLYIDLWSIIIEETGPAHILFPGYTCNSKNKVRGCKKKMYSQCTKYQYSKLSYTEKNNGLLIK